VAVRGSVVGHRVTISVAVTAPGLGRPDGSMLVTERGERIGRIEVIDGRGRLILSGVESGAHHYLYSYTGALQQPVTRRLDVSVA
jgi:hypothetical protein